MRKRDRNVAIGTVVVAAVGYVIGLLTAPKSGRETRKDIKKTAAKQKSEAEKNLKAMYSELSDLISTTKKKAKDAKSAAKTEIIDALSQAQFAKEKAREVLSSFHEGDADDKDLQAAIEDVKEATKHLKKYVSKNFAEAKKK